MATLVNKSENISFSMKEKYALKSEFLPNTQNYQKLVEQTQNGLIIKLKHHLKQISTDNALLSL